LGAASLQAEELGWGRGGKGRGRGGRGSGGEGKEGPKLLLTQGPSEPCYATGPKSRTERPRKTKIGTEVAHVTRESDRHHFQGQRSTCRGGGILWRPSAQLVMPPPLIAGTLRVDAV